jgi:hypothetical protein
MLAKKLAILDEPQIKPGRWQKVVYLGRYLKNALLNNPFRASKAEYMILPHPRIKRVDGRYIDIYTDEIRQEILARGESLVEVESPYRGEHKRSKDPFVVYDDLFIVIRKLFQAVPLGKKIHDPMIERLQEEIRTHTGISIDLAGYFASRIRLFKADVFLYGLLLKRVEPKRIYLTVHYGKGALIHVAKQRHIETIELQHGTFSRYHLGYAFGTRKTLAYFPDQFWVWSDFWKNLIPLPLDEKNIVVRQFAYMQKQKEKYAHIPKNPRQIIVLSQGAIGEEIADVILRNITCFDGFEICYKLHPGEYDRYREYPSLVKLMEYDTVTVVKEADLYALLAQSYYQIGVFSTAIYEGIEMGCKTILLNITGVEYMEDILAQNQATFYREGTAIHVY